MLAEVHTIYETNARSIPDMLREAADNIEAEAQDPDASQTKAVVAIQLTECGQVQVYGWGETDDLHALGLIECGKAELIGMLSGGD